MSKVVKKYFKCKNISCLDWPGNSSYGNPIENVCAIIKVRLHKMHCTTKTKLIEAVIQMWFRDKQILKKCKTLLVSTPKCVENIIKGTGGHISY